MFSARVARGDALSPCRSWFQFRIRRRVWIVGLCAIAVGMILRNTLSDEEIQNLLQAFESRSAAYTADETAALSEPLPSIDGFAEPPPVRSSRGTLVVCGGGMTAHDVYRRFIECGGGDAIKLVVIPTAARDARIEVESAMCDSQWKFYGVSSVTVLHTRSRDTADSPRFAAPLDEATAVWFGGGLQTLIAAAYSGTLVERKLHALLDRGGVIGGTSAGAACLSRIMIDRGEPFDVPGLGLVPGTIIDQHFVVRHRKHRLLATLKQYPTWVGLGVDEGTAAMIHADEIECLGNSTVTLCLASESGASPRELILQPGDRTNFNAWRRDALARRP